MGFQKKPRQEKFIKVFEQYQVFMYFLCQNLSIPLYCILLMRTKALLSKNWFIIISSHLPTCKNSTIFEGAPL